MLIKVYIFKININIMLIKKIKKKKKKKKKKGILKNIIIII